MKKLALLFVLLVGIGDCWGMEDPQEKHLRKFKELKTKASINEKVSAEEVNSYVLGIISNMTTQLYGGFNRSSFENQNEKNEILKDIIEKIKKLGNQVGSGIYKIVTEIKQEVFNAIMNPVGWQMKYAKTTFDGLNAEEKNKGEEHEAKLNVLKNIIQGMAFIKEKEFKDHIEGIIFLDDLKAYVKEQLTASEPTFMEKFFGKKMLSQQGKLTFSDYVDKKINIMFWGAETKIFDLIKKEAFDFTSNLRASMARKSVLGYSSLYPDKPDFKDVFKVKTARDGLKNKVKELHKISQKLGSHWKTEDYVSGVNEWIKECETILNSYGESGYQSKQDIKTAVEKLDSCSKTTDFKMLGWEAHIKDQGRTTFKK